MVVEEELWTVAQETCFLLIRSGRCLVLSGPLISCKNGGLELTAEGGPFQLQNSIYTSSLFSCVYKNRGVYMYLLEYIS